MELIWFSLQNPFIKMTTSCTNNLLNRLFQAAMKKVTATKNTNNFVQSFTIQ